MTMTPVPAYSLAERDRRWALARELMAAEGVDALLVYGEREMVYPTLHAHDVYFTNDRPGSIVIFGRDGDPMVLVAFPAQVSDHIEASDRGEPAWVDPRNLRVARHPRGVIDVLREYGLDDATIGVIGIDPSPPWHVVPMLPQALWLALSEELPAATFVGVHGRFLDLASRQSAEEQAVLAYCAAVGDAMAQAMLEATKPGVTEAEVIAAGAAEGYRHGTIVPPMIVQPGTAAVGWDRPAYAYQPGAPRVLAEGDLLLAEASCCFAMRESQHQIAIAVGDVHPDAAGAARIARDAYDAGRLALRPGHTFGDVVRAMRDPIADSGSWNVHPLVHALYPYRPSGAWGAGMRARPTTSGCGPIAEIAMIGADTAIRPGMAFSLEPNCVVGRHTVSIGGTVIMGDGGPVELNPFTAQLLRA
ncbi:MAG TPA: M24 family metallopeptidase [Jatrophihabitantaceae bacterium]|jgi:Xaa-Pro aminopeptidase